MTASRLKKFSVEVTVSKCFKRSTFETEDKLLCLKSYIESIHTNEQTQKVDQLCTLHTEDGVVSRSIAYEHYCPQGYRVRVVVTPVRDGLFADGVAKGANPKQRAEIRSAIIDFISRYSETRDYIATVLTAFENRTGKLPTTGF